MKFWDLAFMTANASGIVLYLALASHGWRDPQEQIPVTGEPYIWAFALPVLGACLIASIVWAVLLLRGRKPMRWLWWLATLGCWVIAICFDFSHH
jgi:hypothetical protein